MAGFSGFTDEEIQRFKTQGESTGSNRSEKQEPIKKAAINPAGKRSRTREKIRSKSTNSKQNDRPPESRKNEPKEEVVAEGKEEQGDVEEKKVEETCREVQVVMEPEKVKELELSNIEKMQQKQKEMEMINKKKEKMLQSALKKRYAKTKRETETLKLVQKELSRLDNLLYTDVQILRDKIDHSCREFDAARKRYERAEAEFISAKMNLHEKTETKDQLTEHLCSIIQQNEERKAKKLSELMEKLELAEQEVNVELEESISEDLKEKSANHSFAQIEDEVVDTQDNKTSKTEETEEQSVTNTENCSKQDICIENNNNENTKVGI
ncbi:RAB6-interacting golgin-like isoform X2 [Dendronephthya gigantea]|uniref:RAB6-interacting golgin-like isoform X2 n=1 Tax=Dendronephthya gigantea TaxID=151771 RepID=UPI00106A7BAA|nr:RAB6-interacting golgin-like isoform X2 [Dendronephthya gigantea]